MNIEHLLSHSSQEVSRRKRRLSSGWDTNRLAAHPLESPHYFPTKRPRQDNFLHVAPNPDTLQETLHEQQRFGPTNSDLIFPGPPREIFYGAVDDLSEGSLQGFGDAYAVRHFNNQFSGSSTHSTWISADNYGQEYPDFNFHSNVEHAYSAPTCSPYYSSASWMLPSSHNSLSLSIPPSGDNGCTYDYQTADKHVEQDPTQSALSLAQPLLENNTTADGDIDDDFDVPDAPQAKDNAGLPYEVCLGMLEEITMTCSQNLTPPEGSAHTEVSLVPNGDWVFIHRKGTAKEYLGLMSAPAGKLLSQLSYKYSVHFEAFVPKLEKGPSSKCCPVHVVVYGLTRDLDSLADDLHAGDMYLQHPRSYDQKVPYQNPQYLVRPGGTIEPVGPDDSESETDKKGCSTKREIQNLITDIFESAEGPEYFVSVEVSTRIKTTLKSHQAKALSLMMEKESGRREGAQFGSTWESITFGEKQRYRNTITERMLAKKPQDLRGGLLADEMGLGKTLTTLSLIVTSLDNVQCPGSSQNVQKDQSLKSNTCTLIVTTKSMLDEWEDQIQRHLHSGLRTSRFHGDRRENDATKLVEHDVVLTTYHTLMTDYFAAGGKAPRKQNVGRILHSISWMRVVLDEAHIIRSGTAKLARAACALQAKYRWCLTGTPLQNRVEDFGSLLSFLRLDAFDKYESFDMHVASPLRTGSKDAIKKLRLLVNAVTLRRTKRSLGSELRLPSREDLTCTVKFSSDEEEVYKLCRDYYWAVAGGGTETGRKGCHGLLQCILRLRQICNHGMEMLPKALRERLENHLAASRGMIIDTPPSSQTEGSAIFADTGIESSLPHVICRSCASKTQDNPVNDSEDAQQGNSICPVCLEPSINARGSPGSEAAYPANEEVEGVYEPSSKVKALLKNLGEERNIVFNDQSVCKSVVFSCWTGMLDLVQRALRANGFLFARLDGSMTAEARKKSLTTFREDPSCTVLLATIGSAGAGIDITVASRVHLLEPQWNPMAEDQALDRVHRMGQKHNVVTTRYIVANSIDEGMTRLQRKKLQLVEDALGNGSQDKLKVCESGSL
ncbi:hypothetical protein K440DRAFT_31423 [Wilcoxina mikolae CBS 423.85]|nr:hypothetical protein K440DRAFT_31423 [Wilcoxina mikolae CBS 423.85]